MSDAPFAHTNSPGNPVLGLMQSSDYLAKTFDDAHRSTLPVVGEIVAVSHAAAGLHSAAEQQQAEQRVEAAMDHLRTALSFMEQSVSEMMAMLYQVDIFLATPAQPGISGKDPKTALEHVSNLFHMYQSELLDKREALADFSCEEITADEFAKRWNAMDEVAQGHKQTMDDLADLLAGLG